MRAKLFGVLAGAGAAAAAYALLVERMRVEVDRYTVTVEAPGLPEPGVTLLHLSDFHFRRGDRIHGRKAQRLLALLAGEHYDIVALTGDLIHNTTGLPLALRLIQQLRPQIGAYSVPGNHDYQEYSMWGVLDPTWQPGAVPSLSDLLALAGRLRDFVRKVVRNELVRLPVASNDVPAMHAALRAIGVTPLVNGAVHVQTPRIDLWIAGLDDLIEGAPRLATALNDIPKGAPLIVLAHNPDVFLDPRLKQADLILAGHTHGGQIRLPGVGTAHTQGTHLGRDRAAGWFRRGRTRLFVSRGLGESIPLRFGVRPQAALIRVVSRPTGAAGDARTGNTDQFPMTYPPALFPPYRPERLLFAVREAVSRADHRQIARLPWRLHRGDPYWTAPARRLRFPTWISAGDAIRNGNEIGLFLAEMRNGVLGDEVVGSIAVWPDGDDETFMVRFGQFEVINEPEVAQVLLEAAETWVMERYPAAALRGPYALDEKRPPGLLIDGFNMPSGDALPYNPPYYPELLAGVQYEPWRAAYAFALPATSIAPPRPARRTWPRLDQRTLQSPIAPDAAGIAALSRDRAWLIAPIWEDDKESLRVLMALGARRLQTYQIYAKAL